MKKTRVYWLVAVVCFFMAGIGYGADESVTPVKPSVPGMCVASDGREGVVASQIIVQKDGSAWVFVYGPEGVWVGDTKSLERTDCTKLLKKYPSERIERVAMWVLQGLSPITNEDMGGVK